MLRWQQESLSQTRPQSEKETLGIIKKQRFVYTYRNRFSGTSTKKSNNFSYKNIQTKLSWQSTTIIIRYICVIKSILANSRYLAKICRIFAEIYKKMLYFFPS